MSHKETTTENLRKLYDSVILYERNKHAFVQKQMKPIVVALRQLHATHSNDFKYIKSILYQIPYGMTQSCISFTPDNNERTIFIRRPRGNDNDVPTFVVNLTPGLYISDDAGEDVINFKHMAEHRHISNLSLLQLRITMESNGFDCLNVTVYNLPPSHLRGDLEPTKIMRFSTLEEPVELTPEYNTDVVKHGFSITRHMLLSFVTMFADNFETFVENFIDQAHVHYTRPTLQFVKYDDVTDDNKTDDNKTDVVTTESEELLKKLNFDKWSYEEKDAIYRAVWLNHVKNDIKAFIKDEDVTLTEDQIDYIARLYVYDGEYDCNLSYWDNLSNLINEEKRSTSVLTKGGFLS